MAWNPTVPNLVATGGADDISFMWRASSLRIHNVIIAHYQPHYSSLRSTCTIHRTFDCTLLKIRHLSFNCRTVTVQFSPATRSPQGSRVLVTLDWDVKGCRSTAVYLQAGATDGATCELRGHTDTVASAGFSSDGSLLATSGLDGGCCTSIYHHVPREWYRLILLAVEAALSSVASG